MIRINDRISLGEEEIEEHFVRASGPGGQNVNKLASAVQLRFDVRRSPSLPQEVRGRHEKSGVERPVAVATAFEEFCRRALDVLAPLVPVVKPQMAFFEQCGPAGKEDGAEAHARDDRNLQQAHGRLPGRLIGVCAKIT